MSQLLPSEQLAFTTTMLECMRADGSGSVGTGFFFQFTADDQRNIPVIVTNNHVDRSPLPYIDSSAPLRRPKTLRYIGKVFGRIQQETADESIQLKCI